MFDLDRAILRMLEGQRPQVTFSCDAIDSTCSFQFWVDELESFFCALDGCSTDVVAGNKTQYACDHLRCDCVQGAFLCGGNGPTSTFNIYFIIILVMSYLTQPPDLTEYLQDEIKGPAKFSCTGGMSNCKFEEDAMNEMTDSIFADPYITLTCGGGECLHYSQVPGYIVSLSPALMLSLVDSSSFIFKLGA